MVSLTDEELGELLQHSLNGWASFSQKTPSVRGDHAPLRVAIGLLDKWGDRPLPPLPEKLQEAVEQSLRASLTPGSEEEALVERFAGLLFRSGQEWEEKRAVGLLTRSVLEGNGPMARALMGTKKTPADLTKCLFKVEASYASRFFWLRRGADGEIAKRGALLSLPGLALLSMAASWKNQFVSTLGMALLQGVDWQAPATSNGHRLLSLVGTKEAAAMAWKAVEQWRNSPTAVLDLGTAVTRLHPFGVAPWVSCIPTDRPIPLELFDAMVLSVVKVLGSSVRRNEQEACLKGLKNLFACQAKWPDGRAVTLDNWRSPEGSPLLPLLAKELLDPSLGFREAPSVVPEQAPIGRQQALELLDFHPSAGSHGHVLEAVPASVWEAAWEMGGQEQGPAVAVSEGEANQAWAMLVRHCRLSHAAINAVKRWNQRESDFPEMPLAVACQVGERMLRQPNSALVAGLRAPSGRLLNAWLQILGDDALEGQRWAVIAWTALLVPDQAAGFWPTLSREEKSQASAWLTEHAQAVSSLCSKSSGATGVKALALDLTWTPPTSARSTPRL